MTPLLNTSALPWTLACAPDGRHGGLRLQSQGLGVWLGCELRLSGVPQAFVADAQALLGHVVERALRGAALVPGTTWAVGLDGAPFCLAGQWVVTVGEGAPVLELREAGVAAALPRAILGASLVARALALARAGRRPEAVDLLRAVVAWFPGVAGRAEALDLGEPYNAENSLAWLALAHLGHAPAESYARALARSPWLQQAEWGGGAPTATCTGADLVAESRRLVGALLTHDARLWNRWPRLRQPPSRAIAFMASPFVSLEGGAPSSQVAAVAPALRQAFYERPARPAYLRVEVHELVAELVAFGARAPLRALHATRACAVDAWQFGFRLDERSPTRPVWALRSPRWGLAHLPLLSRVLASVGLDLAAGLTPSEVRGRWGLDGWAHFAASGERKLEAWTRGRLARRPVAPPDGTPAAALRRA